MISSSSEKLVLPPKPYYVGFSDSADVCTNRNRTIRTNSDIRRFGKLSIGKGAPSLLDDARGVPLTPLRCPP